MLFTIFSCLALLRNNKIIIDNIGLQIAQLLGTKYPKMQNEVKCMELFFIWANYQKNKLNSIRYISATTDISHTSHCIVLNIFFLFSIIESDLSLIKLRYVSIRNCLVVYSGGTGRNIILIKVSFSVTIKYLFDLK